MDLHTVVALVLSGAIGVSLGLLGGGGSILTMPVLVYVAGIEAKESVAMSLAIVGSTSLFGSLLHGRKGKLDLKVAATFGGAGIIGAYWRRQAHASGGAQHPAAAFCGAHARRCCRHAVTQRWASR